MLKYSKTENSLRNMFWGVINKILVMFWPFIIRYLMIRKIGIEYLGLSSLFSSILQMMSLAELGFGSAMVYAMYKPIAENNVDEINALLGLYKRVYRWIGLIILIIGMILIPFLPHLINGSYPKNINIYILYIIYLLNTVCSYWLFAYKTSLFTAYHRIDITSKITGIVNTLMYILQCLILLLIQNYYVYTIAIPLATVVNNLLTDFWSRKMFPNLCGRGLVDKATVNEIRKRVVALLGHKLGAVVTNSTDNLVISAFLGLSVLAVYNNYYQIMTSLIGLFAIINNSLLAGLGNSIVTESIKKNFQILKGITFGNVWAVGWCSICLLCLFQPFIEMWVGKSYLFSTDTVILLALYFYIWKFKDMLAVYKDAAGMWWDDRWKPIVYCMVNIVISIALVKNIGIDGVIIGTIISQLFVAIPWETYVFFKGYIYRDVDLKGSMKNYVITMIQYAAVIIFSAGVTYVCCSCVHSTYKLIVLSVRTVLCIVIPNSIWVMIYHNSSEFKFVLNKLKKKVRKISEQN